ncbi:MAG: hypothetical protein NDJ90_05820 [Oligoflexia bacterium]|nr:hypothetical protein [Oligoflexia bacterium]
MSQMKAFVVVFGILAGLSACGDANREPGSDESSSLVQGPERDSALLRATETYGPLVVAVGEGSAEASRRPWSSWWYPIRDTYLFEGTRANPAPLEKYDTYVLKTTGKAGAAAAFERERLYDPGASAWEGLCNAWAEASIMEAEPSAGATLNGISFGVGDLKALLVKTYEGFGGMRQYGQRFNGDRHGIYDDVFPDQFHRVLQAELFEMARPLIMDKDPGVPVWNTPIWMAQVRIERDPGDPGVVHVSTWLTGASPYVESYDFVGTLPVSYLYTYDLFGSDRGDGTFQVSYGLWTGRSIDDHPDFVSVLPLDSPDGGETSRRARKSRNTELSREVVDGILTQARALSP